MMKMKPNTITAILAALLCWTASASAALTGEWKNHPSFDNSAINIVETPSTIYFTGYPQEYNKNITMVNSPVMSLFAYDKDSGEIRGLGTSNYLSGNLVLKIEYNPRKKYLMIVYDDLNIDFLYEDGHVENLAVLKHSTIPGTKGVNLITFDPEQDSIYMGMSFGYIILDDKKLEVKESRNFSQSVTTMVRIADCYILGVDKAMYAARISSPRISLDEYSKLTGIGNCDGLWALDNNKLLQVNGLENRYRRAAYIYEFLPDVMDVSTHVSTVSPGFLQSFSNSAEGTVLRFNDAIYLVAPDASFKKMPLPENLAATIAPNNVMAIDECIPAVTTDLSNLWYVEPRKGLRQLKYDASSSQWSVVQDFMAPNAPSTFVTYKMAYSPEYGVLTGSHGIEGIYISESRINTPPLLSGLKGGFWKNYSPVWRTPDKAEYGVNYSGLCMEPDRNKYVWMGSLLHGMLRINLEDPNDVIHIGNEYSDGADYDNFVNMAPVMTAWKSLCRMWDPQIDGDGNLFCIFNNNDKDLELWSWTKEQRLSIRNAASTPAMTRIKTGATGSNGDNFKVLTSNANKNLVILHAWADNNIIIYNHAGTLDNTSDDRRAVMNNPTDQDGGKVDISNLNCFFEDQQTGLVWVGTWVGIFTFNPRTAMSNPNSVQRIKVSRNDGTNLADYLLSEVMINCIAADAQNRKWIATGGGGLVCTSADGRTIIQEFVTANSDIPSDIVTGVIYNPAANSILVSTDKGTAEFFLPGADASDSGEEFRAFPNPVAPDYYGYVTIDNLPDNSNVKIVDSEGGVIRDLGTAQNGSIQWDVMGYDHKRVRTGVYYILAAPAGDSGKAKTGKILIMN